jgi:hypothetical protein
MPDQRAGDDMNGVPWRHVWHEFIEESRQGGRRWCARCGVAEDRAIHSREYARQNGYEFVDADQ